MAAPRKNSEDLRRKSSVILPATSMVLETPPAAVELEEKGGVGRIIASVAVVAVVGGVVFMTTSGGDEPQVATGGETAATETPAEVAAVTPAEPTVVEVETPAETPAVVVTDEAPVEVPAEEPVVVAAAPVIDGPACISNIHGSVFTLGEASAGGATWATHQNDVTRIVQTVIDCDGATFNVIGSLDTLDRNVAVLSVFWDLSERHLNLELVPVDAEVSEPSLLTDDDVAFVLR